ncbi:zinc finger CCCH domain-containing protein 67-like isoform X2 [Bidens hawaiensis]|uniref:zinc finger CCCH domain-containing protein 67-like isoform X2 n=1 Tax=Bidens hawaiensis TaxID=980011 RepID=UPI0040496067
MEEESKSQQQLDDDHHHHQRQQQHLDSHLQSQSQPSDELVIQALTHEFQTLVLSSTNGNQNPDQNSFSDAFADVGHSVLDPKNGLDPDPDECRVFEPQEVDDESEEIRGENWYEQGVGDGYDVGLNNNNNNNQEIEIGGFESNGEQRGGYDYNNNNDNRGYEYYPLRPDVEDCAYYMRTGMCNYGSNCKFNHPLRRKQHQANKDSQRQKDENMDMHGQIECKYYLSTAGCKYGKSCKFSHGGSRGKTVVTPVVEYNFLGLPIRPGEKECPYYMRTGSCKYGPNCRFNHPDPGSASVDAPATYGKDGPLPLQPPPQPNIPNMPSWSGLRAADPTSAFVPVMYPPTQNMAPPNPEWNSYQAPAPVPAPVSAHVYPSSDRGLPIPPAFFLNNQPSDTNMYTHQQQPMVGSEFPERPGQPECSYFMKTGDCKYRASCKFHHPKNRIAKTTPSVLSDKGLPLRPDQSICTYYSRYGICKYGPACKYDHPVNYNMNSGGRGYDGSGRSGPLLQQSV